MFEDQEGGLMAVVDLDGHVASRGVGAGQMTDSVKSYLQGETGFGLRLGVACGRGHPWPQPSGTRPWVGSADTLWERNAGRPGSVGGEHEGGLGWAEVANSVGCPVGF